MIQMRRFVSRSGAEGDGHWGSVRGGVWVVRRSQREKTRRTASSRRSTRIRKSWWSFAKYSNTAGRIDGAEDDHDGLGIQIGARIRAALDERDVVALAFGGETDEVGEEARLPIEDPAELVGFGLGQIQLLESRDQEIGEVVEQRAGPCDECLGEVGVVGVHREAQHRVLFGGVVVEERAAGDADLGAQLLDRESGESALGGQPARFGPQPDGSRRGPALTQGRCTFIHEVHSCTLL